MTAPAIDRAVRFLERVKKPVLMGDVCEAIGLKRTSATRIREMLLEHIGPRLVAHETRGRNGIVTRYSIKKAVARKQTTKPGAHGFTLPADLFRGWHNPKTGITGERLG